ncbi:MAG TPA: hypothetical protein VL547_19320 [Dinghuibacter sp.]|uniref:hypothetical protein n=1 Tax=Dinghuibacter sp. TaxID=2024697 RepID=UPI002C0D76FC|nr:hypothetical protein [Dinghuibacter sp.]HTJ14202.1 hypothetical protein [Dinghuibacter sp.]
MRLPLCLCSLLLWSFTASAQTSTMSVFAVYDHGSYNNVKAIPSMQTSLKFSNPLHVGADYGYRFNTWLSLHSGIEYSRFSAHVSEIDEDGGPTFPVTTCAVLSLPVSAKATICQYAFVQTGLLWDFQLHNPTFDMMLGRSNGSDRFGPLTDQTGLGALLNLGGQYTFQSGLGFEAGFYAQFHGLLYQVYAAQYPQKLTQYGFRLSLTYAFGAPI